jgi:hypothetical protein
MDYLSLHAHSDGRAAVYHDTHTHTHTVRLTATGCNTQAVYNLCVRSGRSWIPECCLLLVQHCLPQHRLLSLRLWCVREEQRSVLHL